MSRKAIALTRVSLRPVTRDDLEIFETEFCTPEGTGPLQWYDHRGPATIRNRFAMNGLLADNPRSDACALACPLS